MWVRNFASATIRECAASRRKVISDWRILIVARRIAHADNAPLPNLKKAIEIRNELQRRGDLVCSRGVSGVYEIEVPYSNLLEVSEEQIVQEANPWAVFSHLTAMAYHGITDVVPKEINAIGFKQADGTKRFPLGTMPDEWSEDVPWPSAKTPDQANDVLVHWSQPGKIQELGVIVGQSFGVPIYVTDLERTLLDAIRAPERSGGIAKVLQAWRSMTDVNLENLIRYTESCENKVLCQRVGYLLDRLGRTHPRLDAWRQNLQRGGSVKLVSNSPYDANFSPEWNLSLNVPSSVLAILEGD